MKSFLVIGLGRFGRAVACELGSLGHEVLALDNSEENVQHIADSVTQAICGDAQDEAVLRSLGVGNFDCCVVAIGTDIEASDPHHGHAQGARREAGRLQALLRCMPGARARGRGPRHSAGEGDRAAARAASRPHERHRLHRLFGRFLYSGDQNAAQLDRKNARTARRAREVRHQRSGHPAR
ncbi:MAG: potassium channel family protein [Butyricicoccaceae bacterium]